MSRQPITSVCLAALIAAAAASAGCVVRARATPVGYAELSYGTGYRYYPHTYYDGRDVYYIGGRWMYQDGSRWSYYTTEPAPLYRYRTTIREAPPAPRYSPDYYPESSGYVHPPQPAPAPPQETAPPPARVR